MMLQHMVDLQSMEIKYLKELLPMKKITLQIQHPRILEPKTKMTLLEAQKESLIKVNIKMKSNL